MGKSTLKQKPSTFRNYEYGRLGSWYSKSSKSIENISKISNDCHKKIMMPKLPKIPSMVF